MMFAHEDDWSDLAAASQRDGILERDYRVLEVDGLILTSARLNRQNLDVRLVRQCQVATVFAVRSRFPAQAVPPRMAQSGT